MRTTIDIPEALLTRARERALAQQTTLRAVVADALRSALDEHAQTEASGVTVPTYGGSGLAPDVTEADLFTREERDLDRSWREERGPRA